MKSVFESRAGENSDDEMAVKVWKNFFWYAERWLIKADFAWRADFHFKTKERAWERSKDEMIGRNRFEERV